MGYYVRSIHSNFFMDKVHFDAAYKKLCELNDYDELKRGGQFGSGIKEENDKYNKNKWFSWMDYNYPETCPDMFSVLSQVGFGFDHDDEGNLVSLYYDDNKTGNEDYFLCALAPFVKDGSFIVFKGEEDDDYFRYIFKDGYMYLERGQTEITWVSPSKYEFGKLSETDLYLKNLFAKESV